VGPKEVVGRRVEDVITGGRLELIDELFMPDDTPGARAWIEPFRRAFPDVEMKIVELVAEGDRIAGRFKCSATQLGEWRGQAPTNRRFRSPRPPRP
jgi:predicted ester cyclase